ncbi:hypothetical protein [Labrys wisconsinensis]|uniref:Uncharacterized protein n=1 Tax=Labrys wisconsinensis TaxID=425677 RepID=A0ABU0JM74_9HYPH|nr:hypothetical protein [Labrys wisconsinensis]MDQ0474720.1 hypothetical protein [Labrys wisconsinensis]
MAPKDSNASKELLNERKVLLARTARLRELRLAKEAEEREAAGAAPPKKPAVRKPAKKKRAPAAWPW